MWEGRPFLQTQRAPIFSPWPSRTTPQAPTLRHTYTQTQTESSLIDLYGTALETLPALSKPAAFNSGTEVLLSSVWRAGRPRSDLNKKITNKTTESQRGLKAEPVTVMGEI